MKSCTFIELETEDLQGFTKHQLACSDCIKGYCPSRTVAFNDGSSFIFCGARKIAAGVLDAYRARTGSTLAIQRPE